MTKVTSFSNQFNKGVVTKQATYKANGRKLFACTKCGARRTQELAKIKSPTAKDVKVTKNSITFFWNKAGSADGYQIRYSTKSSMKKAKTMKAKASAKFKKIKKLKANAKYYIQVRAYKKIGKKTVYSAWAKAKIAKTKK